MSKSKPMGVTLPSITDTTPIEFVVGLWVSVQRAVPPDSASKMVKTITTAWSASG